MNKKFLVSCFGLYVLLGTITNTRAAGEDSVDINDIYITACNEQEINVSGVATYSEVTQHLIIDLDGVEVLNDTNEPLTWSVGSFTVTTGQHTITAAIYDKLNRNNLIVQDVVEFTVDSCNKDNGEGSGGDSSSGGDEEGGDEEVIEEEIVIKSTKQVKGIQIPTMLPTRLKSLNSVFRLVFDRGPTFKEWEYWANRMLGDKPQISALFGAMQWHQVRGSSIGDVVL